MMTPRSARFGNNYPHALSLKRVEAFIMTARATGAILSICIFHTPPENVCVFSNFRIEH